MAFVSPSAVEPRSAPRPLEVVASDLIIQLAELGEAVTGDQADAIISLQNLLYSRLAAISAFRQLITPDVQPADNNALILELISVADSKKAILTEQIDAELICLRALVQAHNEIRDVQWMTSIVALTEAKAHLARVRKLPFCRTYASLHWMTAYLGVLVARAHLYFDEIVKRMPGGSPSGVSTTLSSLIWRQECPLMAQIESSVARCGALCACLVHDGLDADSMPATMRGYRLPDDDAERLTGLRAWSCIYSYSASAGFSVGSHWANIVCLLMEYGEKHAGRAVLHKEPGTAISYLYMPVEIRIFMVVIWNTRELARAQAQFSQTWTALGKSIRDLPIPSLAPAN